MACSSRYGIWSLEVGCAIKLTVVSCSRRAKSPAACPPSGHSRSQHCYRFTRLQRAVLSYDERWAVSPSPCPNLSCNLHTDPVCSLTYTWLVDGKTAKIPAPKFINRVEKWIVSKIHDPVMFPTDPPPASAANTFASGDVSTPGSNTPIGAGPTNLNMSVASLTGQDWIGKSSGFPQTFYKDCQGIMKQMFRCYAHLYHGHWENPFWHLNKHEVLNMCFVHFITVAKYFKLVADKEMEPMQPLIDIFVKQEKIPPEAIAGHWAQASSA